jgi:hypothetical protein
VAAAAGGGGGRGAEAEAQHVDEARAAEVGGHAAAGRGHRAGLRREETAAAMDTGQL